MFAATFAVAVCNGGYADAAAAAAFAGGGDGGFAGFGDGDFAGGLGVCFTFDASRRLDASTCSGLGGGASSLGCGVGLVAPLAFPVLLDLDFDFGAGADDALEVSPVAVFFIRLIAASLVSDGRRSNGGGFVGTGGCDWSISGGGGDVAFAGMLFWCVAVMLRKNFPI